MSKKKDKSKTENDTTESPFGALMGDTVPIKQRARHQHRSPPKPKAVMRRRHERAEVEEPWVAITSQGVATDLGEQMTFQRPQVNKKTLRELRRGKLEVQEYIDLHGMTVAEAMKELRLFIAHCANDNLRCVRIVTGKGLGSKEGPKIRPNVMLWLQQCESVMAYTPAPQQDGGTGALYVLLG